MIAKRLTSLQLKIVVAVGCLVNQTDVVAGAESGRRREVDSSGAIHEEKVLAVCLAVKVMVPPRRNSAF
jgi:hypothetical protein